MPKKNSFILFYRLLFPALFPIMAFHLIFAPVAIEKAHAISPGTTIPPGTTLPPGTTTSSPSSGSGSSGSSSSMPSMSGLSPNTSTLSQIATDAQNRAGQRGQEGSQLAQRGKDLLRDGFNEGDKTLDYAYGEGARFANQTATEALMLLSVVIIFLAFKLILGGIWKLVKGAVVGIAKLMGKGKNWKVFGKAKCLFYPTDILIVTASLIHLGLEALAAKKLYENIKGLIESIQNELSGNGQGPEGQATFQDVVNDPILDVLLVNDPQWLQNLGDDMVGSSLNDSQILSPIVTRRQNIQSAIDCINRECSGVTSPTDPKYVKCQAAMALIPSLQAQLKALDTQMQTIYQGFSDAYNQYSGQIPDLSSKLREARQMVGQYEPQALSYTRIFSYVISILDTFLKFEEERHFAFQMSVVAWILALTSAIAKKFIPQVVECFGWTDYIKIVYIMLVIFIYVGYSPAFFMPASSVKAKSQDKAHEKDGWVEVPAKGAVDKIPGVKGLIDGIMDEYDQKYREIKDLVREMRAKLNQNLDFENSTAATPTPNYASRQEIATLIMGIIPFHDHRMGLLKDRISAMKDLESRLTALYSDGVTFGQNVMNDLREFRERVRQELGSVFNDVTANYNTVLNNVDAQIGNINTSITALGFACTIPPGPPAPVLTPPPAAPTPTPSPVVWKEFLKFKENVFAKLRKVEREQEIMSSHWEELQSFWNYLGMEDAYAKKAPTSSAAYSADINSCVRKDLLPDPQCSCRSNRSCYQVDLKTMAMEVKDRNALSYLNLANKLLRGDSFSQGEEKFVKQYYRHLMSPQNLGRKFSAALNKVGVQRSSRGIDEEEFKRLGANLLEKMLHHGMQEYRKNPATRSYFKATNMIENKKVEQMLKMVGRTMPSSRRSNSSSSVGVKGYPGTGFGGGPGHYADEAGETDWLDSIKDEGSTEDYEFNIDSVHKSKDKSIWEIIGQRYRKRFFHQ